MFVDITMSIFLFMLFFPISFMTLEDICSHDNRHFYFLYFFNFFSCPCTQYSVIHFNYSDENVIANLSRMIRRVRAIKKSDSPK